MAPAMNQFFDINKLPAEEGILWFPISMARISNSQNAASCFEYLTHINPIKVTGPTVGLNFCYGDFLYFYSDEKAGDLKKTYSQLIISHKNNCRKILKKPYQGFEEGTPTYFIEKAFAFDNRNKLYLDYEGDIMSDLSTIRERYSTDALFKQYVLDDLHFSGRDILTENQLMFFLEEHLIMYLIGKGRIKLHNEYVKSPKWFLICYPGPMLKHQAYILQKNFLNVEKSENKYELCQYDLVNHKLYDASRMDLETYNYE